MISGAKTEGEWKRQVNSITEEEGEYQFERRVEKLVLREWMAKIKGSFGFIRVFLCRFPNTYLLVGVCSDAITHKFKGKTVITEAERYESLRHCKWVDEVIPDAPWVVNQEFLDQHKIDFVAHDSLPYAYTSGAGKDVYEFVKAAGRFKETQRTDGISTSDIIMRIVKDYNQYVMRNLARGYKRKELNLSYVKEKRLRVNMRLKKLHEKVKKHQEKIQTIAKTAGVHRNEWVENADRWVAGFLEMFEEGCHKMGTAIRDRIQERLMGQQSRGLLANGKADDDESEEYFDHDDYDEDDDYYYDEDEYYYDDDSDDKEDDKSNALPKKEETHVEGSENKEDKK